MSNHSVQSRTLLTNASLHAQRQDSRHMSAHSRNSHTSLHSDNYQYNRPLSRTKSKRNSVSSEYHYSGNPQVKLENSYCLGPGDSQKFSHARVSNVVNEILSNSLKGVKYEPSKCKKLVLDISEEIKRNVKAIVFKRYKIVVSMAIGQITSNESLIMGSRALWNAEHDNECTVNYKNGSLYAIATIFAVYLD